MLYHNKKVAIPTSFLAVYLFVTAENRLLPKQSTYFEIDSKVNSNIGLAVPIVFYQQSYGLVHVSCIEIIKLKCQCFTFQSYTYHLSYHHHNK